MTESNGDEPTGIYQPISDSLLIGDYVEVKGVCLGKDVFVELLTHASPPTLHSSIPLRVHMMTGGVVVVSSVNPEKHEEQEKAVRYGIEKDQPFNLCILATEEGFKITLNNEPVCIQKYLVDLEAVQAIGVDGVAVFTDIEFKDIYSEEGYNTPREETPIGFIRMQELRESSMRKKGNPVYISAQSPRPPVGSPGWQQKTPSDAERQLSNEWAQPFMYTQEVANTGMSRSESSLNRQPITPEVGTVASRSSKSGKGIGLLQGRRKSATLDHSPEPYYVGAPSSKVVGGGTHPGTYQVLDDEMVPGYRPDSRYTMSSGTQEKKSKRKFMFGSKGKKSQSNDSDTFFGEENQKEGKSKRGSIFSRGKKGSATSTPSAKSFESLSTQSRESMDTDVTLRNKTFGRGVGDPLYLGVATEMNPVRGALPKNVAGGSAAEMASYISAQRALPEFENYKLINVIMEPTFDSQQSRPISTQYINEQPDQQPTSRTISSTYAPRESYNPRESMPPVVTVAAAERPVLNPKDIKGTAPEMAAIIDPHHKYTAGVVDNTRMINDLDTERAPRVSNPIRPTSRQLSQPDQVRIIPTTIIREPASTMPRTTVYQETVKTLPVSPSRDYYIQDPPRTAATLYEKHNTDRNLAVSDGSLADAPRYQPMQPREVVFQKPKIDVDLRSPTPVLVPEPVPSHRIYSMPDIAVVESADISVQQMGKPTAEIQRRNSIASVDGLDAGFYLVAGNSPYYHERARSVRGHRSRRSLRRESGTLTRSASRGSSISSFRAGDIAEFRADRYRKSGQTPSEVSNWLRTQPQEENPYPVSAGYRMQYAAPTELEFSTRKLRKGKTNMTLPATITFPEHENSDNRQCVALHTMLTADSKTAKLVLTTDEGEDTQFDVNFEQDRIVFCNGEEGTTETVLVNTIPFIPEQVMQIKADISHGEGGVLRLYLNDEEMCATNPAGKRYRTMIVRGDLKLLSVQFE